VRWVFLIGGHMAKKIEVELRGRIAVGFGSKQHGVFQVGDIITQKDLPKAMSIEALIKTGIVEVYGGDLVGLSEKAMLAEIKALKEENEALKAMG